MRYLMIIGCLVIFASTGRSQQIPARDQAQPIALKGGTAHIGDLKTIENSVIVFEKGKLTAVGDISTAIPEGAKVIDATGKHIYPGIIAPNTVLGLMEIGAVRATRDYSEVGVFKPHVRSIIAFNTDSRVTPTIRSNGVLMSQVTPRSGVIPGASSVVELDAWNWEDAVYKEDVGIHLNWPRMSRRSGWWGEPGGVKKNKKYNGEVEEIKKFLSEAEAYSKIKNHKPKNIRFEAMRGLFDKTKTLFVHTNFVKEILEAIDLATSFGVSMVLVGGRDSWMITDKLVKHNIPVILFRIHTLPSRRGDDIDLPYKTPYLLKQAGVLFCLGYQGGMEHIGQRNIPFIAGTAAAYGLTKEEALMSITSNTARILGIDKTVGTLTVGKDATLFISTGDALDMRTNNVEHAFIRGKQIDLENKQKALYRKFREKYFPD